MNGTNIQSLFLPSTLFVKIFGTILSLSAGLYIGIEAPAIHIGGAIGALIAHMPLDKFTSMKSNPSNPSADDWWLRFRNDEHKSKLIMCGLAAGVSAGFMSPMGGICFVIEEAQTFWNIKMTMMSFLSSLGAGFVYYSLLASAENNNTYYLSKLGNFMNTSINLSNHYI